MFRATWVTLLAVGLPSIGAAGGQLTDRDVARVIERAGKLTDRSVCIGDRRPGQFNVCIQGPEQRIASAAFAAKQARQPLRPASVSDEMRAPTWVIFALPNAPALVAGRFVRAPSAEQIQLRAAAASSIVNALGFTQTTYSWDNPVGETLTAQGITATFDARDLPLGAVEVVVTTEDGPERRYLLPPSARERIR